MKKCFYIFIFLLFASELCHAQKTDALFKIYNNKNEADTSRLKAIHKLIWFYKDNKPDTALILASQALEFAQKSKQKKYEGQIYSAIGTLFSCMANYPKALNCFLKSLKICQETVNKSGEGRCYNNIGTIYKYQSDFKTALTYFFKGLQIAEKTNDQWGVGSSCNDIGNVYLDMNDYNKALAYYEKDLKFCEQVADKQGMGLSYGNIGGVYNRKLDFANALIYYEKGLKFSKEVNDKSGVAYCYGSIGELYISTENLKLAILYLDSSLLINNEIGDIDQARYSYENLADIYAKTGKYKEAYENHVKFKQLTDSIFNADNSKQLGDMKTQFEVDKKEAELKIKSDAEQEKLKAIALEEKKRQQVIIVSAAGVLLVVIMFSLFLYKRFRITQRQKTIIEKQKQRVDEAYSQLHERNKEVMDSIHYAKRIQTALITSEKYIENSLNKLMKK